ncbi:ATP-binding protein [Dyadobacter sp. CY343]|uniref:ATP-binding protein n=1 Tax=Dyadobacter sp. CY343 TaxID=2907299 RepID=UPI001F441570|nr:ATP-binding protein [Dyadobacter sp. CY343]MCE7061271.1 ATP-binding protein [Dyadobacter sp. CY343]
MAKVKDTEAILGRFSIKVIPPRDLRTLENTEECLNFFRDMRDPRNRVESPTTNYVSMDLSDIVTIDYATISILTAISDDLKANGVILSGNFPKDQACKNFIAESGFLSHMYFGNKKGEKAKHSDLIFFEKGSGKLSERDSIKIGELIKGAVEYLTGKKKHHQQLRTVILEICGNAIEHASTKDRQWLLGVKLENEKVQFTIADVGKGILDTLHRKYTKILGDLFNSRSDHEVLARAFVQKYGSSTKEVNRNKGLPAIKEASENGTIVNLVAITNNVVLNFGNPALSRTLSKGAPRFRGTFYQWEINKDCIS